MKTLKLLLGPLAFLIGFSAQAQITSITPAVGNRGQTLPIIISGQSGTFNSQGTAVTTIFLQQGSSTMNGWANAGTSVSGDIINIQVNGSTNITADLTIPGSISTGFYNLWVYSGTGISLSNAFEVQAGPATNSTLSVGGGQPGNTVTETIEWQGLNISTSDIDQMWLSLNGNTLTSLTNANVVFKNSTKIQVDVAIPQNAEQGYWTFNLSTKQGDVYYSPASFHIDAAFSTPEDIVDDPLAYVAPNPVREKMYLYLPEWQGTARVDLRILDMNGKVHFDGSSEVGEDRAILNVEHLTAGIYFVQLMKENRVSQVIQWVKE